MWSVWRAWSVLACAGAVLAQRIEQEPLLSPRPARVRDRDVGKPDEPTCDQLKAMWSLLATLSTCGLVFSSPCLLSPSRLCLYYPVLAQRFEQEPLLSPRPARVRDRDVGKPDEPTCDQLKAMWRFSKRQARAPEIMNEVSSYRDPLMYNEWPVYTALPRAAPRFRYQYPTMPREAYGRVVTKAPPNVVRTPDYDEMFGMLNVPHTSGKILRYPGPSRPRGGPTFMVPPQRDRFEALKKLIRQEHVRELQRKYETEQKQELKEITAGRGGDDYAYGNYGEQEPRGLQSLQVEYPADEPNARQHNKKPQAGSRQVSQFSRYSDVMLPPVRRTFYHPYYDYITPDFVPYY